jgi:hypothetical protein
MIESIWTVVILFSVMSLVTSNPTLLIAGLILAAIGISIERFYR